ncbi:hypothetical protein [Sporolactobacillus vineae]|uniref:hypothetical protein n=1 Tax=Sporolactobacillus vineae TaxID=444463 RepID=UPI000288751C|nr:hypothetical protein [Sporolactobacillus vineae]
MEQKKCFLISPIGEDESEAREKVDSLIDDVLDPLLQRRAYRVYVSHRIRKTGSVLEPIIGHILNDDLVIANLTGLNPNVLYELAIRHACNLPAIVIAEKGTRLPFDLTDERTFFYTDSFHGASLLTEDLNEVLSEMGQNEEYDNPIYRSISAENIMKGNKSSNFEKSIIARFNRLESLIKSNRYQNLIPNTDDIINIRVKINEPQEEKCFKLFENHLLQLSYITSFIKIPNKNAGKDCFKYLIPSINSQEFLARITFDLMKYFEKNNIGILLQGAGIGYGD